MIWAVILTFIITALSMLVLFMRDNERKQTADKNRLLKENDGLRRQISDYNSHEQCRRERHAYNQGLYDGRGTDALYRQCLKKYTTRDQVGVMMNGERGENE